MPTIQAVINQKIDRMRRFISTWVYLDSVDFPDSVDAIEPGESTESFPEQIYSVDWVFPDALTLFNTM
ncbi:hypothetical protein GCM10027190_17130 [Spirosoma areae]